MTGIKGTAGFRKSLVDFCIHISCATSCSSYVLPVAYILNGGIWQETMLTTTAVNYVGHGIYKGYILLLILYSRRLARVPGKQFQSVMVQKRGFLCNWLSKLLGKCFFRVDFTLRWISPPVLLPYKYLWFFPHLRKFLTWSSSVWIKTKG